MTEQTEHGPCERCRHYRRVKPPSQLFAQRLGTVDEKIAEALSKMAEDEQKQRDAEAEFKKHEALREGMHWGVRPVMSPFCGLDEDEDRYLIAEIKNRGFECEDFERGSPTVKSCEDCIYRVPARGWEADVELEQQYGQMAVEAISAKASSGTAEGLLSRHREGAAGRRAFEARGAYIAMGVMATEPKYLDWCRKLSGPGEYFVCLLHNAHATCHEWSNTPLDGVVTAAASVPAGAPPSAGPAPPVSTRAPVANNVADDRVDEQTFARLLAFLQWILQVQVPAATAELLRATLVESGREGFADWLQAFAEAGAQREEERVLTREQIQVGFVDSLRAVDHPLAVAVVALYDAASAPIAPGSPPLTAEAADAVLDIYDFMSAVVTGVDSIDVTPELRETWRARLAQSYPTLGTLEQQWIGNAPLTAAMMRAGWARLDAAQQELQRQAWAVELPRHAAFIQGTMQQPAPVAPPPAWAAPQPAPRAVAQPAQPVPPSHAPGERSLPELFDDMAAAQDKAAQELEKTNPELALQKKMQDKEVRATLLSNMMQMEHETIKGIIQNIRV